MVQAVRFALPEICDQARWLVLRGKLSRHQAMAELAAFYSAAEWQGICEELTRHDFCLNNPVCELMAHEEWSND